MVGALVLPVQWSLCCHRFWLFGGLLGVVQAAVLLLCSYVAVSVFLVWEGGRFCVDSSLFSGSVCGGTWLFCEPVYCPGVVVLVVLCGCYLVLLQALFLGGFFSELVLGGEVFLASRPSPFVLFFPPMQVKYILLEL